MPRRTIASRSRSVLMLAGVLVVMAFLVLLAGWNVASLIILQDHSPPLVICWAVACLLWVSAALLLIAPERRRRMTAPFALAAVVIFCAGGAGLVVVSALGVRRGELVDRAVSADGRYEVRISHWTAVLGEDGWDVAVQRRDGLRFVEAAAGCLYSEVAAYDKIQSVEPGRVRIGTDEGVIDIGFDPATMRLTERIPAALCAGYE